MTVGLTGNFGEDIFLISGDFTIGIHGMAAGEQPLQLGVSHSDLTVAEVKEALDATLANPDDIIAREHSRRPVRTLGVIQQTSSSGAVFNDGKPKRQRIKFSVGNGFDLDFFCVNRSGGVLTTGAIIEINCVLYGRWQR